MFDTISEAYDKLLKSYSDPLIYYFSYNNHYLDNEKYYNDTFAILYYNNGYYIDSGYLYELFERDYFQRSNGFYCNITNTILLNENAYEKMVDKTREIGCFIYCYKLNEDEYIENVELHKYNNMSYYVDLGKEIKFKNDVEKEKFIKAIIINYD